MDARIRKGAALLALGWAASAGAASPLAHIDHVIVIYQENWSFDALYAAFPGADGEAVHGTQVDLTGTPYGSPDSTSYPAGMPVWEPSVVAAVSGTGNAFTPSQATCYLPNGPFLLSHYLQPYALTQGDPPHAFYLEQAEMDHGRMDKFVAWSSVSGLAMSQYDGTRLPEGILASQYTLCDRFFHGSFGGSFLNHLWMISAQPPTAPLLDGVAVVRAFDGSYVAVSAAAGNSGPGCPACGLSSSPNNPDAAAAASRPGSLMDMSFARDGRTAVNTIQPWNPPHATAQYYLEPLTGTTVGDLLSARRVSWKWYAGGWAAANGDTATAATPATWPAMGTVSFQFHHQPFNYFARYAPGTRARSRHLADEVQFSRDLFAGRLPSVCFIKPAGVDNEHPGYSALQMGQDHVRQLVQAVQSSPYWKHCLIVITYDEHGGRWDHVAPPGRAQAEAGGGGNRYDNPQPTAEMAAYVAADPRRVDAWGPGSRVPTLLISPYVRHGFVDHTIYDSTSILALLENRFCGRRRLATRDAAVNSLELSLVAPQP